MEDIEYFYVHEKPAFAYRVLVSPPPADDGKAEVHAQSPKGTVLWTAPLNREVGGTLTLDLAARGVKVTDSPLYVSFLYRKGSKTQEKGRAVAVAEPAPGAIAAPLEAHPDEELVVHVNAWDAMAWDLPGLATVFREENPGRIPEPVRAQVRWWLEGKPLDSRGEAIALQLGKEHLGKRVRLTAFLGEKLPKKLPYRENRSAVRRQWAQPAEATIAVPRVVVRGPETARLGETVELVAAIEPPLEGTFVWSSKEKGPQLRHVCAKAGANDVRVTFTSKLTGRRYEGAVRVRVAGAALAIALEKRGALEGHFTLAGADGSARTLDAAQAKDLDASFALLTFEDVAPGKYDLGIAPPNGAPEYFAFRGRDVRDEDLASGDAPPPFARLVVPRLVYAGNESVVVERKHVYLDLESGSPPASGTATASLFHAHTDAEGRLRAVTSDTDEDLSHPVWVDAGRAGWRVAYAAHDHLHDARAIPEDAVESIELVERDEVPGEAPAAWRRAGPEQARVEPPRVAASATAVAAPGGDARRREWILAVSPADLDAVQAELPIDVSFGTLRETREWVERNPIEVRIDGATVGSHAIAKAVKGAANAAERTPDRFRILVHFRIPQGKHSLLVSSRSRRPAGKVKPVRVVHLAQDVTVTTSTPRERLAATEPPGAVPVESVPAIANVR